MAHCRNFFEGKHLKKAFVAVDQVLKIAWKKNSPCKVFSRADIFGRVDMPSITNRNDWRGLTIKFQPSSPGW